MIKQLTVALLLLFGLVGCGYRPTASMIAPLLKGGVSVDVDIDSIDPQNSVGFSDALKSIIYGHYKASLRPRAYAKNHLRVAYAGSRFIPIAYEAGYVVRYRVVVRVRFRLQDAKGFVEHTVVTDEESDIQKSSLRSSVLKEEAIARGMRKALDEFDAFMAVRASR